MALDEYRVCRSLKSTKTTCEFFCTRTKKRHTMLRGACVRYQGERTDSIVLKYLQSSAGEPHRRNGRARRMSCSSFSTNRHGKTTALDNEIERVIRDDLGFGDITSTSFLGGSSWSSCHRLETTDGHIVFAKTALGRSSESMFRGEALGLQAMYGTDIYCLTCSTALRSLSLCPSHEKDLSCRDTYHGDTRGISCG